MMKPRTCPKCRGPIAYYTEVWNSFAIEFEAVGGIPEKKGTTIIGDPAWVEATCSLCLHHWRLRGITQITELREEADE